MIEVLVSHDIPITKKKHSRFTQATKAAYAKQAHHGGYPNEAGHKWLNDVKRILEVTKFDVDP